MTPLIIEWTVPSLLHQSRKKYSLVHFMFCLLLYSTAKSKLHVYDETPILVNLVLMSLTELYLQQIMQVSHRLWKVSLKSILVTNIEWENPTANAPCSYIDSIGYASGPIRRCLFIDYIIKQFIDRTYTDFKKEPAGGSTLCHINMINPCL